MGNISHGYIVSDDYNEDQWDGIWEDYQGQYFSWDYEGSEGLENGYKYSYYNIRSYLLIIIYSLLFNNISFTNINPSFL